MHGRVQLLQPKMVNGNVSAGCGRGENGAYAQLMKIAPQLAQLA